MASTEVLKSYLALQGVLNSYFAPRCFTEREKLEPNVDRARKQIVAGREDVDRDVGKMW
jgi:hypothetical protein